jgi:hypothetical protein
MKFLNRRTLLLALATAWLFQADVLARPGGGPYEIRSTVIGGGGSVIAGGDYELDSTIGQPATATLEGGQYRLFSGFWAPANGEVSDIIFRNGFEP